MQKASQEGGNYAYGITGIFGYGGAQPLLSDQHIVLTSKLFA